MNKIIVTRLVTDVLEENTYILSKNGRGVLIDPSGEADVLDGKIADMNIVIDAVLLTHGHFDHCMLAKYYRDKGISVYIHKKDAKKLKNKGNLSLMVGISFPYTDVDVQLDGGETLKIADMDIKVIFTPGHSNGSVCYLIEETNALFTGDLIMKLSYGRTDFYSGDFNQLIESIRLVFALKKDYTIYAGHGDVTTLAYEKRNNLINIDAGEEW